MVPEKLEEFLRVLSEFEKDPESRTSLELMRRLKPVLKDWPELLRDFAAFLHPDQAEECGLVIEPYSVRVRLVNLGFSGTDVVVSL